MTCDRLRELREAKGWSRAELARQAGMNASTVGQIELGRILPYPTQVAKLAGALRVREDDLLSASGEVDR